MRIAGTLLVVVGCLYGTAMPGRAQTGRTAPAADASASLIEWSNNRRLTHADFRGVALPAAGITARSFIEIKASWTCEGDWLVTSIHAVFDPARSWWGGQNLSRYSMPLLQHEQTHFDLAEVMARKIRSYLSGLTDACTRKNGTIPLASVVEDFQHELDAEQARYDRETSFGTDLSAQVRWTSKALKALE